MHKKLLAAALLCLWVSMALGQDYGHQYQQQPAEYHRPAPARLQPGSGPVEQKTPAPPVAILKQINRHNEDGSYTYGFEGADGSFKIETKAQTGEVKGKYGYVDETGKVRVVEYGADKHGFQPSGDGITVPPPTFTDESSLQEEQEYEQEQRQPQKPYIARVANPRPLRPQQHVQPQYEPKYEQNQYEIRPQPAPQPRRQQYSAPAPQRAIESGSQLSTDVTYSAAQRPPRPDPEYVQRSNFGPAEQQQQYEPNPVPRHFEEQRGVQQPYSVQQQQIHFSAPRPVQPSFQRPPQQSAPIAAPRPPQQSRGGLLDQLQKDFALPANGAAALHDISFGYY